MKQLVARSSPIFTNWSHHMQETDSKYDAVAIDVESTRGAKAFDDANVVRMNNIVRTVYDISVKEGRIAQSKTPTK